MLSRLLLRKTLEFGPFPHTMYVILNCFLSLSRLPSYFVLVRDDLTRGADKGGVEVEDDVDEEDDVHHRVHHHHPN